MYLLVLGIYSLIHSCLSLGVFDFPTTLYSVPTEFEPAFLRLVTNPLTRQYDIAYSSFTGRPNEKDKIFRIPSVSQNYQDKGKMASQLVTDEIFWPNEVSQVPDGSFGSYYYWTSASAFFLDGKDNGSISLIDMTDPNNPGEVIYISPYDGDVKWYYHRVLWADMDYDGDVDAITARAYGNATHATEAQLIWLENPGVYPTAPNWNTHIIHEGEEDVGFRLQYLTLPDGTKTLVIISSGFFSQALTLTWTTDGDWTNPSSIQHRIIDSDGWYFDLRIADLNQNGLIDIVVTTWYRKGYQPALLAYEMPAGDWRVDEWKLHVISTDFRETYVNSGNGAPGSMTVFWPAKEMEDRGEKPHIILSGDDDGHAYLFVPISQDSTNWTYKKSTIFRALGTIGSIAVGDVDGDGYTEVFLPGYSTKQLVVMSYKP